MINALSAADIAFIMSSSTSAWLLSPSECSPQKQTERFASVSEDESDLPSPITCKSGGFKKQAQKNLEIRTSNLETSEICVK